MLSRGLRESSKMISPYFYVFEMVVIIRIVAVAHQLGKPRTKQPGSYFTASRTTLWDTPSLPIPNENVCMYGWEVIVEIIFIPSMNGFVFMYLTDKRCPKIGTIMKTTCLLKTHWKKGNITQIAFYFAIHSLLFFPTVFLQVKKLNKSTLYTQFKCAHRDNC